MVPVGNEEGVERECLVLDFFSNALSLANPSSIFLKKHAENPTKTGHKRIVSHLHAIDHRQPKSRERKKKKKKKNAGKRKKNQAKMAAHKTHFGQLDQLVNIVIERGSLLP
jgi:hypothetical protein